MATWQAWGLVRPFIAGGIGGGNFAVPAGDETGYGIAGVQG